MSRNAEDVIRERTGRELKDVLNELYWDKGWSQRKIAKELGLSTGCVCEKFKLYGLDKRDFGYWVVGFQPTEEHRRIISETHKGKKLSQQQKKKISDARKGSKMVGKNPRWTGRKKRVDGYIQIRCPEHPASGLYGYVMEHKLVMEKHLNRYLTDEESVHHINHDRSDNRIENLFLFKTMKDHAYFHMKERHGKPVEMKYEYNEKGRWKN